MKKIIKHISILAILIAFLSILNGDKVFASTTIKTATTSASIVGWWPLNEGTSTVAHDISVYNSNGTLISSPSVWASGKRGGSLFFDGTNQYIDVPQGSGTNLNLSSYSSFTVSTWVYLTDTSVGHALFGTGNPYNNAGSGTIISYGYPSANQFGWQINNGVGSPLGGSFGSVSNIPTNQWLHVSLVYTSTTLSLYINGTLISTADISTKGIAGIGNNIFRIGAYGNSPVSQKWQGRLDDVRIYSQALSITDIKNIYQIGEVNRKNVSQNGLVAWWTFDEGTSTTAHDFSEQSNSGLLFGTGGPTWVAGKRGSALSFAGQDTANNQTVTVTVGATNPELAILGDVTVSAWIKPSSSYFDTAEAILRVGQGSDLDYSMFYDPINKRPYFHWYDGGFPNVQGAANTVPFDRWSHVTIVRSGLTLSFYVNGVFTNSAAVTAPTVAAAQLAIGRTNNAGVPQDYSGSIDDLRVYNRALSATEISTLYNLDAVTINHPQNDRSTNGLVGLWSFNGGDINWTSSSAGTAYDRSGNNNNGTLTGMIQSTSPVSGRVGQALSFDGATSYVQIPYSVTLAPTSALTFGGWFKTTDKTISQKIISKTEVGGYAMVINEGTGGCNATSIGAFVGVDVAGVNTYYGACYDRANITNNKWHHAIATYDSETIRLYFDGVEVSSNTLPTGPIKYTYNNPLCIGTEASNVGCGVTQFTSGGEDEIRVYNRALSAAEIKQLYLMGK